MFQFRFISSIFLFLSLSLGHARKLFAQRTSKNLKHQKQQHASALLIQKYAKRRIEKVQERRQDTLNKIIKAQSGIRMHIAKQKKRKLKFFMAVMVVQRIMQKFSHKIRTRKKKRERQIILAQACVRGYLAKMRVKDIKYVRSTVIVQSALRRRLAIIRKRKLMYIKNIVIIQSIARRYLAWKATRPLKLERTRKRNVMKIQCLFRCWKAWKVVDHLRFLKATVHVQSCLRRFKARLHVRILRQRKCVGTLQKHWRGYLSRKAIKQRNSAILLQKVWKGCRARRAIAPEMKIFRATMILQCAYRCYLARRKLRHKKRRRLRKEFQTVHNKRVNDGIHTRLKRNASNIKKAIAIDTASISSPPLSPSSSVVRKAKAGPAHIANAFDPSQVQIYCQFLCILFCFFFSFVNSFFCFVFVLYSVCMYSTWTKMGHLC